MDLLDPNPGGLVLYDDLWMINITGVDHDIDLLQDLNLVESLAADNLLIEVSVYEDTRVVPAPDENLISIFIS